MRRYTLRFVSKGAVDEDTLRRAVEDALERLHPGLTYRMGQVLHPEPNAFAVEIGSEGKREILSRQLKRVETRLPVELARIDWGWDSGDASLGSATILNPDLPKDPFGSVAAAAGPVSFPIQSGIFFFRYILFFFLTALLAVSTYQKFANLVSPDWDILFIVSYPLWLFSLSGIQLDPRSMTRKIVCGEDALEVCYWLREKPVRLRWADIWGMDFTYTACVIRSDAATVKIAMHEKSGYKDKKVILKTVADRSSLRFVEGRFWNPWYRRAEAP